MRSVMRGTIFGTKRWKPFFDGFMCSKYLITSSTKRSCFRFPAAEMMKFPGVKRLL